MELTTQVLIQFTNCRILRHHQIISEDFWVRNGKIINPEKIFFDEKSQASLIIDCKGKIIAPGFIDLQINGKNYIFINMSNNFISSLIL